MDSEHRDEDAVAYYCDNLLGAATYDGFYAALSDEAVKFYVACTKTTGGPVLELGCGTGLVTWALAAAGHEVTGLDLSPQMLQTAKAKGAQQPPEVRARVAFQEADMTDFQLERSFKTVVIPGRSFQHILTPEKQRAILTRIHDHLAADGRLILNIFDPKLDYCLPGTEPPVKQNEARDPETGRRLRRRFLARTTDPMTQTFTEEVLLEVLDEDGEVISKDKTRWSLRWSYAQEMRYLFELTGFRVEGHYGDYAYGAPAYAKEQIWICRKL